MSGMSTTVWVTAWQLQCCGDPFDVGSAVRWTLVPPDVEWLATVLGAELAEDVTGMEEHHDLLPGATEFAGRVRSIRAVVHELEQRSNTLHPVAGSTVLTEIETADGWYGEDGGGLGFAGYLVDLDPMPLDR
jgi:hypothetical protein